MKSNRYTSIFITMLLYETDYKKYAPPCNVKIRKT